MIKTYIKNNFLNIEEINILKKYIYNELKNRESIYFNNKIDIDTNKSIIQEHAGRLIMHFNLHKIPEQIYQSVYDYALSINAECVPYSFIFSRHSKDYGMPKLLLHIDNVNIDFTIYYQLQSNINWNINIENEQLLLKDNDALIFASSNLTHWRDSKIFEDKDYLDIVFFHFVHKDKKMIGKRSTSIKGDYIFEYYKNSGSA
jgi:hypothetical protein